MNLTEFNELLLLRHKAYAISDHLFRIWKENLELRREQEKTNELLSEILETLRNNS